jgi:hypothetical protein
VTKNALPPPGDSWYKFRPVNEHGVTVTVGELFPWKGSYWQAVSIVEIELRDGTKRQGVVIIPTGPTDGATKRATKKRKK